MKNNKAAPLSSRQYRHAVSCLPFQHMHWHSVSGNQSQHFVYHLIFHRPAITLLHPSTSVATGFSQYTCLPAATAASRNSTWLYAGEEISTASTSLFSSNLMYAFDPW